MFFNFFHVFCLFPKLDGPGWSQSRGEVGVADPQSEDRFKICTRLPERHIWKLNFDIPTISIGFAWQARGIREAQGFVRVANAEAVRSLGDV